MILKTIAFKRTKTSKQEVGIEVEGSVIIDIEGKIVPAPIWNATDIMGLQMDLNPLLQELKTHKYTKI